MPFARKTSLLASAVAALGFSSSPALSSGPKASCRTYQPIEAMTTNLGSKSALAYFVRKDGACSVALMISEKVDLAGAATPTSAARVRFSLPPGENVSMDSEEGGSLMIQCGHGAAAMQVTTGPREEITAFQQKLGSSLCAPQEIASAAAPLSATGFGPPVSGDASLNGAIGVLTQKIAWLNSPESDVYQLAIAARAGQPFEDVALASDPMNGASFAPVVHNDPSLNANEAALSQWIAYRNSPGGDAFRPAEPETAVASAVFLRVALASIARGSVNLRGQ